MDNSLRPRIPARLPKVVIGALVLGSIAFMLPAHAQDVPPRGTEHVYIDAGELMQSVPGAAEAQASFERRASAYRAELEAARNELTAMEETYREQRGLLTAEARERREDRITARRTEIETLESDARSRLSEMQASLLTPLHQRLDRAIQAVRRAHDYAHVHDASSGVVLAADPLLDVTDLVAEHLAAGDDAEKAATSENRGGDVGGAAATGTGATEYAPAYLDSRRLVQNAPGMAEAQASMSLRIESDRAEVDALSAELEADRAEYDAQHDLLTAAARSRREEDLRRKEEEVRRRTEQLENLSREHQQQLIQPILASANQTMEAVRRRHGYGIVLDVASADLSIEDPSPDVTEEVLRRMQRSGAVSRTAQADRRDADARRRAEAASDRIAAARERQRAAERSRRAAAPREAAAPAEYAGSAMQDCGERALDAGETLGAVAGILGGKSTDRAMRDARDCGEVGGSGFDGVTRGLEEINEELQRRNAESEAEFQARLREYQREAHRRDRARRENRRRERERAAAERRRQQEERQRARREAEERQERERRQQAEDRTRSEREHMDRIRVRIGQEGSWSDWMTVPSRSGLRVRVGINYYNDTAEKWEWHIQFRNDYRERVCHNYRLAVPGADRTDHRHCVGPDGSVGAVMWFLLPVDPGETAEIMVDNFCRAVEDGCWG